MARRFSLLSGLVVVGMLAALCVFVAWLLIDRQRLSRERDDARHAAEWNYKAAVELEARSQAAQNDAGSAQARADEAESRRAIAEERPGIDNIILQHSLTK